MTGGGEAQILAAILSPAPAQEVQDAADKKRPQQTGIFADIPAPIRHQKCRKFAKCSR